MVKYEYMAIGIIVLIGFGVALGVTASGRALLDPNLSQYPGGPDGSGPKYLVFNEWDEGTTAVIHPHDIITIRLPENPTTGYQWDIAKSEGLRVIDDSYVYPDPSGRMTGEGGWRRFTLMPDAAGSESFSAVYKRSWDEDGGNGKTYSLQFRVV
jgi:inhibitor of cysteine peptidase